MINIESVDRIKTAIALGKPDRPPVIPVSDLFDARHRGVLIADFITDFDRAIEAKIRTYHDLGGYDGVYFAAPPTEFLFALLSPMKVLSPGKELPPGALWQFQETELISEEQYELVVKLGFDQFREYLFQKIKRHSSQDYHEEKAVYKQQTIAAVKRWTQEGVPCFSGASIVMPFDFLSYVRTFSKFVLDLYRKPEQVLEALQVLAPEMIKLAIEEFREVEKATGQGYLTGIVVAARSAGVLSPKLFEKFVFPFIKQFVDAYLAEGITPCLHFDSDWSNVLDYFTDFPKGKIILQLDGNTDIFKAKKILGDRLCIMGDVPASLLKIGTVQQVKDYCRRLIEEVGGDGGFILSSGCAIPDDAKFENVKAMVDAVKETA